ncbi:MAG: T9SS type A sorting domain-containing protein [Flavobacterium sp.]|nr:MAG: T9SS type A sorting domain-containing protein [Flavobacterium sp.]
MTKKLLCLTMLFLSIIASSQIVTIPDPAFKARLLQAGIFNSIAQDAAYNSIVIDTNHDNEIQVSEALVVYKLTLMSSDIVSLEGISAFSNLGVLNCSFNDFTTLNLTGLGNLTNLDCTFNYQLTTLDLSGLTNLSIVNCSSNSLTSLNLSGTTNLNNLNCVQNELSELDLTGLSNLYVLYCGFNNLTSLDLSPLTNIISLSCGANNINTLDASPAQNLEFLDFRSNNLTSVNLQGLVNLENLGCPNNLLTSLDLSGLTSLKGFECFNNQLTELDFTGLTNLTFVTCHTNSLTTLDFSDNPLFNRLDCHDNNLSSINIKNGTVQNNLVNNINFWYGNPNLTFICIDDNEAETVNAILADNELTGININSYCSFNPGGNYNTIAGTTVFDAEGNGCGAGDSLSHFLKVKINDGTNFSTNYTNSSGNYSFFTDSGSYTVNPVFENGWFTASPASVVVDFPLTDGSVQTENFCITAIGVHNDIEVVLVPLEAAQPGFNAAYKIVYKNNGNQTLSGSITFEYDDALLDYVNATPAESSSVEGTLTWDYSDLAPFENREIGVTMNVNGPMETPAVNIDDVLSFNLTAPISGDENPGDNSFSFNQVVIGSFDPNDITCLEGETAPPDRIGEYLHYTINFENTGTAPATFVVVKNQINPAQFDISTLQLMNASHEVLAKVTGNNAEFIFNNINLAPGAKGNLVFKIRTLTTLQINDDVTQKAGIFFDYNFPIETNEANTIFEVLGTGGFQKDNSVTVFPNPSKGTVTIRAENNVRSVQVFDVQGRLLQTLLTNENSMTLDMASQRSGIYFIKIKTDSGMKVQKLIKD